MKAKQLGDSIGVHHLRIGKVRKQLFPESSGDITPEEEGAIRGFFAETTKEIVKEATKPQLTKVKIVFYDPRFPEWVDAVKVEAKEEERVMVQLPYGYDPDAFIGKEVYVYERKLGDERSIYQYSPWIDGQ